MQGLKQYYYKQGKSLYISKYNIHKKKKEFLKLNLLNLIIPIEHLKRKKLTFWLFFFISGYRPFIFQKKTRNKFHSLYLKNSFHKNYIFNFLEKFLSIFMPNTTHNNLKFKIYKNLISGQIFKCSSYIETDNLFFKKKLNNFSFNLQLIGKSLSKNNFLLKLMQIPL